MSKKYLKGLNVNSAHTFLKQCFPYRPDGRKFKTFILYLKFFILLSISIASVSCNKTIPEITILPLEQVVMLNKTVSFKTIEKIPNSINLLWDFGDGTVSNGNIIDHVFTEAGIFHIKLYTDIEGEKTQQSSAIVRVHSPETISIPQVFLDTDARCEADDQHFIAYSLYSNLDVIGINSIHNNSPGSELINYGEIFYVMHLMNASGMDINSLPMNRVFHGAGEKLTTPSSGVWYDTEPIISEGSEAILAAARGASPENPVWIMAVGPCTNIASAALQARKDGFNLKDRIRVIWLGGNPRDYIIDYNGKNDPWSVYVMGQSGLKFKALLTEPASLKLNIDKRAEADLYPDNALGKYLLRITPVFQWNSTHFKSIHDVCVPASIISDYNSLEWVKITKPASIGSEKDGYKWLPAEDDSNVELIWDINGKAMKDDLFNTLNGHPVK